MIKSIDKIIYSVFLSFLAVLFLFLLSCRKVNKDEEIKVDFSRREAVTSPSHSDGKILKAAVAAMISPKENFIYYAKIVDYISQKTGKKIAFKQRESYGEVNELLKLREVDFAFICSGAYVDVKKDFGAEILVVPQIKGNAFYQAYIVVRKNSGYDKFEDLKGWKFAFTDPLSNTGCLYPKYLLKKINQPVESFFSDIVYTHAHDYSLQAVINQLVDGASVDSIIFDYIQETHPQKTAALKIIKKSEPFAMPPVVVHPKINSVLKKEIQNILLHMDSDSQGREILAHLRIDRFILAQDRDYDSIRAMNAFISESIGHEVQNFTP